MNNHYTYFIILCCSLAGPLALSFDKKVGFYKKWKYLFPAMLFPAFFYIVWDIFFTKENVWSFNENYITGIKLINLPVEEVLFFFVVPYCCVFIYECVRFYFPVIANKKTGNFFLQSIAIILLVAGLIFYKKYYTNWSFILCSLFVAMLYVFKQFFKDFKAALFLAAYAIILIPFLLVNGFLTDIPVVLYNDAENLGIRIYTIPLEDIFYGMLLIMMNIALYEKFRNRKTKPL